MILFLWIRDMFIVFSLIIINLPISVTGELWASLMFLMKTEVCYGL